MRYLHQQERLVAALEKDSAEEVLKLLAEHVRLTAKL
jgi:DNA-binding GntR family transcriptional regulator